MSKSKSKAARAKKIKAIDAHPFADFIPMMDDAEYRALKDDVVAKGKFDQPVTLYQGKLLDGRNRQRVALETGIPLKLINFIGSDAAAIHYVYSRANRRNLDDSQKACAAVHFLPHFESQAKQRMLAGGVAQDATGSKLASDSKHSGKSRDFAGSLFGVSGRYVQDAKTLFHNDKKLFRSVFDGKLPLSQASRQYKRTHASKTDAVDTGGAVKRVVNPSDYPITVGDAIKELKKLPRRKFRLAFIDPPYNLGFKYDADTTGDRLPAKTYLSRMGDRFSEAYDVLTADGAICVMICEEWVAEFKLLLEGAGFTIRRLIVWHEGFGQAGKTNFGRTCRYIWYAVKDPKNFVFNEAAALVPSKRATVYGDARAMPDGQKVADALWDFPRVAGTFKERIKDDGGSPLPTQLPEQLVTRAIGIFTDIGDEVIDFFGGSGTTLRACAWMQRKCTYIDQSKKYAGIAQRELAKIVTFGPAVSSTAKE